MCGFVAIFCRDTEPQDIESKILKHRGPDFTEQIRAERFCARHWRLSVIDLSESGNQPLVDENNIFVYNGEIYDFEKIGLECFDKSYQSDTRLVFDLLRSGLFSKFRYESGFYSFLLYNKMSRKASGSRDFFGKKNLYYYFSDKYFCIGSEEVALRSVLKRENINVPVSQSAFLEYLEFKDVFLGKTYFDDIYELAPGATFEFDQQSWSLTFEYDWNQYYSSNLSERLPTVKNSLSDLDVFSASKVLKSHLKKSVEKRFVSDVDVQIALSGGTDSTLVAAIVNDMELNSKVARSLTVASNHSASECDKAKVTSSLFGFKHQPISFDKIDFLSELEDAIQKYQGPLSHPHSIAYNIMCREVAVKDKVLITGEGADEIFWGYEHHQLPLEKSFAFRQFLNLDNYFVISQNGLSSDWKLKLQSKAKEDPINCRDLEIKTHLLSLLKRNDKMSMANSVELRSPFLDVSLLSWMNIFNQEQGSYLGKSLLKEILLEYIPEFKFDKEKIGFYVPFDQWFSEHSSETKVKNYVSLATGYLEDNANLKLRPNVGVGDKLAWLLLNIGIFLDNVRDEVDEN